MNRKASWEASLGKLNTVDAAKELNTLAISQLRNEEFSQSFDTLKKVEMLLLELSSNSPISRQHSYAISYNLAITFNNLSCYFLLKRKISAASLYLQKAKDLEYSMPDRDETKAVINLNLSVSYLLTSEFKRALDAASQAESFINYPRIRSYHREQKGGNSECRYRALVTDNLQLMEYDDSSLFGIGNYYTGLAYEALGSLPDAYLSFKKGNNILAKMSDGAWGAKFVTRLNALKKKLKHDIPYLADTSFSNSSKLLGGNKHARNRSFESARERAVKFESRQKELHGNQAKFEENRKTAQPKMINSDPQFSSVYRTPQVGGKAHSKDNTTSFELPSANKALHLPSIFENNQSFFTLNGSNGAVHHRSSAKHGSNVITARRGIKAQIDDRQRSYTNIDNNTKKPNWNVSLSSHKRERNLTSLTGSYKTTAETVSTNNSMNTDLRASAKPRRFNSLTRVRPDPKREVRAMISQSPSPHLEVSSTFQRNTKTLPFNLDDREMDVRDTSELTGQHTEHFKEELRTAFIHRVERLFQSLSTSLQAFDNLTNNTKASITDIERSESELFLQPDSDDDEHYEGLDDDCDDEEDNDENDNNDSVFPH